MPQLATTRTHWKNCVKQSGGGPDEADMKAWGLDADGWYSNIFDAIEALEDDGE